MIAHTIPLPLTAMALGVAAAPVPVPNSTSLLLVPIIHYNFGLRLLDGALIPGC